MNFSITKTFSFVVLAFAALFAFAPAAFADGINENIPCSSPVMIAINGQAPNNICWYTSVNGHDGQKFTVVVTVANSAPISAPNVTVDLTDPENGSYNSFTFHEVIKVNGTTADTDGAASIHVTDGPATLEFLQAYRYQAGQGGAGTPVSASHNGNYIRVNMGTVPSGTVYSAKFEFRINSEAQPCDPCDPCGGGCPPPPQCDPCDPCDDTCPHYSDMEVRTDSADDVDEDSATLNGYIVDDGGTYVPDAYFYLSTSQSAVNNGTAPQYSVSTGNLNEGDDFNLHVNNLDEGETYYFKACAENALNDSDCGSVKNFETDGNNNDDLQVNTLSPDDVDENSAVLVGEIDTGDNVDVWFELSDDEDEVDNGDADEYNVSNDQDEGDEFEKTVSGLDEDTKYYYRACGEDQDGNEDCGTIKSFTTDDGNTTPTNTASKPSVSTLPATSITTVSAQCNGVFASNGANTSVYFKYGTNPSGLQFSTQQIQQGISSGAFSMPIAGLLPSTLYYCQAYAQNSKGTVYGDAIPFRTATISVINPPTTVVVNSSGGGSRFARIIIENGVDVLSRGQQVVYHVEYENISRTDLEDSVVNVEFPKEVIPLATTRGTISKSGNSVTVKEGTLSTKATEEFFVTAEVRGGSALPGQLLTASATIAYDYEPGSDKTAIEEAIAFDADTFADNGNFLAGLALFGGFFPGSLAGWLILLLILLAVFAIVRRFYVTAPRYHFDDYRAEPRGDVHSPREY